MNSMVTLNSTADNIDHTKLAALERLLIDGPDRTELLQAYFQEAIVADKLAQARRFLHQLQQHHPWNHSIRKLFIALCLQQKDYPAAMDAVETLMAFSTSDDALIDSAGHPGASGTVRHPTSVNHGIIHLLVHDREKRAGLPRSLPERHQTDGG